MNISQLYSAATNELDAGNFDAALSIVAELKTVAPAWKKIFMLEARIFFARAQYLRALTVLENLLPRLNLSVASEKILAADALSLSASACRELGFIGDAVAKFRLSAKLEGDSRQACAEMSNALFAACHDENFSRADFDELYAEYKTFLSDVKPFKPKSYAHKKVRVGFVSADFGWHAVMAWSWALLTELDKNFFATCLYSASTAGDEVTEYLRATCDLWRDISDMTDFDAAKLIRDDEIDILFDLSGHTSGNRLRVAAYKPAPVQISGVGYMNSTGLDCFDYFLSDVHCAGDESWFAEKLIRLPNSHICYNSQLTKIFPAAEPPCLRNGFVTFASFNNFAKVTDTILVAWKKILDRVPESRLLLKHKIFSSAEGRNFVAQRLKNFGFDLRRVEMRGYTSNHAVDYADIDVALDTFPYTGGVTTCENLWMGVPVVSLYGDRHGTRFGLSMLTNVGLDELAVATVDEYISRAVMLACDSELLILLRRNLRDMMKNSPLMNSSAYVRDVEKIFKRILSCGR